MIKTTAEQLRAKAEEFLRSAPFHFPRTPRLSEAQDLIRELLATIAAAPSPPFVEHDETLDVACMCPQCIRRRAGVITAIAGSAPPSASGWQPTKRYTFDDYCEPCITASHCSLRGRCLAEVDANAAPPGTAPEGASPAPQQELLVATKRLAVEVSGMLGTIEHEMREAAGNTNVNVLIQRWEEAKAAIAKADAALDAGGQE